MQRGKNEKCQRKKCKIRSKGVGRGSCDLRLKFWDPFHIPGTGEARNLKFGTQIDHSVSHLLFKVCSEVTETEVGLWPDSVGLFDRQIGILYTIEQHKDVVDDVWVLILSNRYLTGEEVVSVAIVVIKVWTNKLGSCGVHNDNSSLLPLEQLTTTTVVVTTTTTTAATATTAIKTTTITTTTTTTTLEALVMMHYVSLCFTLHYHSNC